MMTSGSLRHKCYTDPIRYGPPPGRKGKGLHQETVSYKFTPGDSCSTGQDLRAPTADSVHALLLQFATHSARRRCFALCSPVSKYCLAHLMSNRAFTSGAKFVSHLPGILGDEVPSESTPLYKQTHHLVTRSTSGPPIDYRPSPAFALRGATLHLREYRNTMWSAERLDILCRGDFNNRLSVAARRDVISVQRCDATCRDTSYISSPNRYIDPMFLSITFHSMVLMSSTKMVSNEHQQRTAETGDNSISGTVLTASSASLPPVIHRSLPARV
ncbi:hypothetical protein J6590_002762 [Homalodisca vitripennis]|nr:hypothetical protein J6590_002762 [Homalodisca vitripennis]